MHSLIIFFFLLYIYSTKSLRMHVVIVQLVSAFWRLEKVWRARLNKNDELYIITRSTHNIEHHHHQASLYNKYNFNSVCHHAILKAYKATSFCFVCSFGRNHYIVHFSVIKQIGVSKHFCTLKKEGVPFWRIVWRVTKENLLRDHNLFLSCIIISSSQWFL